MSGTDHNVDLLAQRLQETKLPSGISFAGKGLKLDTADDGKFKLLVIFSGHCTIE